MERTTRLEPATFTLAECSPSHVKVHNLVPSRGLDLPTKLPNT